MRTEGKRFGEIRETKITRRKLLELAVAAAVALIANHFKLLRHVFRGLNKSQQNEAASFQLNFLLADHSNNKEGCVELYRTLAERYSQTEDPEYKSFLRDELDVYLEFLQKMENFEEEALRDLVSELNESYIEGKIDRETFTYGYNLISQRFPNSRHLPEMQRLLQQ